MQSSPIIPICGVIVACLATAALAAESAPVNGLWPRQRTGHILRVTKAPDVQRPDPLDDPAWKQAEEFGPFFSRGMPEDPSRATQVRMLCSDQKLFIAARCLDPEPAGIKAGTDRKTIWQDDSLEFIFTGHVDRPYPYVHLQVNAAGTTAAHRTLYPHAKGRLAPAEPIDLDKITVRTGRDDRGWWAVIALPMDDLRIGRPTFRGNVVRNRPADGSDFAWSDLWGDWFQYDRRFQPLTIVEQLPPPGPRLVLPATLAWGTNHLRLSGWAEGFELRCNDQPVPVDADGNASLRIDAGGPVCLRIVNAAGRSAIAYWAEVSRPLIVEAAEPFQADPAAPLEVDVTVAIAPDTPLNLVLSARQDGKPIGTRPLSLAAGRHRVRIELQEARPGEIEILAEQSPASVQTGAAPLTASHRCVIGLKRDDLDRYRPEIDSLPTLSRCRAALADACNYYRILQAGDGRCRNYWRNRLDTDEHAYGMAYAFALIYTADWPENPYHGDKRFLDAAVATMEAAFSAEAWPGWLVHPPNRNLQAWLLTYGLLKDRLPARQERLWRDRLTELVEITAQRWLRPAQYKFSFYSEDVGTGSNHYAYHVANVYTAGKVLERPDWLEQGRSAMRRFARHGRDGFFPERRGVPVVHYSWLSTNALGQYYWQSSDPEVLPTLERCVEFLCRTSLPGDASLLLHEGRSNTPGMWVFGDFVLSLTPQGRRLAGERIAARFHTQRRPGEADCEAWFRFAETAGYFRPGPEAADEEFEYAFLEGRALIARRQGFIYGLSAICVPPVTATYQVDPQNAIELNHATLGRILSGANSQQQPEAGSFHRKLSGRTVFLPTGGYVERTDSGHAAILEFDTFRVRVRCDVLSAAAARITVDLLETQGDEPVVFSFFPVAPGAGDLPAGSPLSVLPLRNVQIHCSQPVQVEQGFQIMDPYSMRLWNLGKATRAHTELARDRPFVLEVRMAE